jgi:hypothetical protein
MRVQACLILIFLPVFFFSQRSLKKKADELFQEGQTLYVLESASVSALDLFYDKEFDPASVKGYFSYFDKDTIRTVFYREIDTASAVFKANDSLKAQIKDRFDLLVISKTMNFVDKNLSKKAIKLNETERKITEKERALFEIRFIIFKLFNDDPINFVKYEKSNLSIVILEEKKMYKAYVMNVFQDTRFVPIGNDYYFEFDKAFNLKVKKPLHKTLIPIELSYRGGKNDEVKPTFHNHKGDTASEFITSTDICQILLFKPALKWDMHVVYGEKYVSVFNLYKMTLEIVPRKEFEERTKPKENKDELDLQIKKEKK